MKRISIIALTVMVLLLAAPSVHAHFLWLNIDNYQPRLNETVQVEIGWGHKFPTDEVIKKGFLNQVYALDPSGKEIPLTRISITQFRFIPKKKGVYRILANIHPGFLSKTTEGYKLKPKKGLTNVLSCFRFDIRAKSILIVESKGRGFYHPAGDPLEIIPLKNPALLKEGDIFPLKVLYKGNPLPHVYIHATYAGFSDQPNTFAYSTMSNELGEANIRILKKGHWLVNVTHKIPYPDPEVCDETRYNHSFTFEVK